MPSTNKSQAQMPIRAGTWLRTRAPIPTPIAAQRAAAAAISGQDPDTLLAPAIGLVVLALYALAAAVVGARATARRDVA